MNDPVTITAYFSEDLPPDVAKVRQEFKELLVEYANYSDGQIVYEFVNPNESQETEVSAQQNGIRPVMINVRERDQVKQQRAYLGAILQMGERKETIPLIQPGSAMEYALSSNIKKISLVDKPKIGFLQGNGEPGLSSLPQLTQELSVMYEVDTTSFSMSGIPSDINTLVIIAPKDTIPNFYFRQLDDFLKRSGRLLIALNRVEGNMQTAYGEAVYCGLSDWLKEKGIEIENNFVIDVNCSNVMVRQQQGMFVMNTPVEFPYLPIVTTFADHPITKGLEAVVFPFVSPIKFSQSDTSIHITLLATTSEKSGIQNVPVYFDISKRWSSNDFNLSSIPIAAALEGNLFGNTYSKMVVFSDGDFAVNGEGQQAQQLQPDNISLMVNAIDWLSDDTGLTTLRTKEVTSRTLDAQLEDGIKTLVKYLNFCLPILLIIAYGVFRFQLRKKLKHKLMSIDYVK